MKTENQVSSIQDSALRTHCSGLRWGEAMKQLSSILLIVAVTVVAATAQAQQPTKIPRIGFLITSSPSVIAPRIDAFRQGLRELGYVEGKNIVIERRHAEGKLERLPALAAELVRLKVDVLVSSGPTEATSTIP